MSEWQTFTDNRKYWISTSNLNLRIIVGVENMLDYNYETMVFPIVEDKIQYTDNVEWLRTNDEDDAYLNHLTMFEKYNNL